MSDLPTRKQVTDHLTGNFKPSTQGSRDELMVVLWAYADGRLVSLDDIDRKKARKRAGNIVRYILANPWMSADEFETNITTLANATVDAALPVEGGGAQ